MTDTESIEACTAVSSVNSTSKSIDLDSLAIVNLLRERFKILSFEFGLVSNIYMVFMHDLVVHFSGILMQRVAVEHYSDKVQFPWVDKKYACSPYLIEDFEQGQLGYSQTIQSRLRQMRLTRAALGEALPFGYQQDQVLAKIVNLLGSHQPFCRAFIPKRSEQIGDLLDCISELCRLYEITNAEIVRHNWLQYLEFHTMQNQPVLREKGLLLGTRNILQNRKLAVNFLQQDKEVVAVTHGEVANSVMDEPPFGYSERTLCTTLVDYGNFDRDGDYNKPLIPPCSVVYRDAPVARSVHQASDQIKLPNHQYCRALYIPTTYSGNSLYGPFHIYEDALYRRWQLALLESYPALTIKAHPKSRSQPPKNTIVDYRQLEECIHDYELFVFDYFATGSMLALVSDKPVIYFDIGLRRLNSIFEKDIKIRCEYAKIDLDGDLIIQVQAALARIWANDDSRSNAAIAKYALCEESRFNWLIVLNSVARGTSPA